MIDIRAFRQSNKISQKTLADFCGVTQGAVSQWENGLTSIPSSALELLIHNEEGWDISLLMKETSCVNGNHNNVNNGHDQKIIGDSDLIEAVREAHSLNAKSQEQIDRLISIIERLTNTQ